MSLTIDRLSLLADGVAHGLDGTVHVAMALPGEVIEGTVENGRIAAPSILTPSPDRVKAPCPHYRACGGCLLQHASESFVAGWKAQVVETALAGRGIAARVARVETSPEFSRRRATFSGRRTKKGTLVGFHARASDTVVEVPQCRILRPELLAVLPALNAMTAAGASRKGEISFAVTLSEAGLEVAAKGGKEMEPTLFQTLAGLAEQQDFALLSWEAETVAARRPALQSFGAARVNPPPGAFLQATAAGEAALVAFVRESTRGALKIADLFAGCGTFALPLAAAAEVHAVESEAAMLMALDKGWRGAQGLKLLTHEARDLFRRPLLPDEIDRFDAVVIDPPRAGAEAQVAEIAASKLRNLTYVSCNPVTFARDAEKLVQAGFALADVIVVDQFRHSAHIELAASFRRT
ncbi:class I SAM-dependent RNA methyltransferase [Rhodobacter capsulatus]|uniref:class I SAM-dependent RNA methyltransferase n=1 Tax=Rhodobacter capsulatus TaxID=1061 RepID=UPI0006DC047B|nr:class I SAM-dependent RNA methyltransferase [Rhodobacter capsulatus]KQB11318.1 RNA methyltransferase [Rhodobacter capsulatus]KQB14144.1 RNA methyltransferase [Rhodobacter capsulatus]PZX22858.1 23S rRNA (uracil1939-C5)-methyltransferase [Rhodobacter capsulatus]QNR63443.1 class I SAM-dependent RNA methyltransferase [Rhodobacter capsulatus]